MITSLKITRLRGIREGKLENLTPLVVLVGPNACGKSTVLDALLIGASPSVGDGIGRAVLRHHGVKHGARWLLWRAGEDGGSQIRVSTAGGSFRYCDMQLRHVNRIACESQWIVQNVPSSGTMDVDFSGPGISTSGTILQSLDGVPQVRIVESPEEHIQTPLDELVTECTERGHRSDVRHVIGELVPGVNDVLILTEAGAPIVHIEYADGSVPAALAGDGIHSLLRIALELFSSAKGVVLLEEPEIHQHPGAMRQTIRVVLAAVRRGVQVVLTTHSLELIDLILAESSDDDLAKLSVYRLNLDNGKLVSNRMPGDEVAFSRMTIENDLR